MEALVFAGGDNANGMGVRFQKALRAQSTQDAKEFAIRKTAIREEVENGNPNDSSEASVENELEAAKKLLGKKGKREIFAIAGARSFWKLISS